MNPSKRIRVRRRADRGSYDEDTIHAILDEALICHVGFVRDGYPVVIPTIHARDGDQLFLHGSPAAGFVRDLSSGIPVCVTATIVDGLVLARSANHHSMNYRSVVVYGEASPVTDRAAKIGALKVITDHIAPDRWPHLREINEDEIRTTAVLRISLDEASAKIRTGGPIDPDDDVALPIWAGVLPLSLQAGDPITDALVPQGVDVPDHVRLTWGVGASPRRAVRRPGRRSHASP